MSGQYRLPEGGRIDRSRTVRFKFNGRQLEGFAGDTVASALLAAGVRLIGRSFRLHRPRGLLSSGLEEPNGLVHVRLGSYEEPNVRATLMPVLPGLEVVTQNAWPSLRWDVGELFDLLPKLWPASFYHKTFMWPSWEFYEPLIRRAAGIGRIRSADATVGTLAQTDLETDVLICGGGLAGATAAAEAARSGATVTLLHADEQLGGRSRLPDSLITALAQGSRVAVLTNTVAVGVFGERIVLALEDQGWEVGGPRRRLLRIRARSFIVATGMLEQPLAFEHNDRPGVMLASAVTRYLDRYAVRAGRAAVLVANNDAPYRDLTRWQSAGIELRAIIDSRESLSAAALSVASALEVPILASPRRVAVKGRSSVRRVRVVDASGRAVEIECDLVATSGGGIPNVHLFGQALGALRYDRGLHAYAPSSATKGVYATGGTAGLWDPAVIRSHASSVGRVAFDFARDGVDRPVEFPERGILSIGPTRFLGRAHRQWLDYQHDVTIADAAAAVEQGYTHVEHFKRYTTTGMAIDQGKTSLRSSLEQLARHTGQSLEDLKPPTYRPPYVPLSLALAAGPNVGRWYRPERRLPSHAAHVVLRARFDDVGGWLRPLYYAHSACATECIAAEIHAVRNLAGIFDASPLGKLEVSGPDALEFLDRLYVNNLRSLTPGKVRYALMLRDDGTVLDDGTVACVGPDEFLVTTTSGNAERIHLWMREWAQCEWPRLKVLITPVTTAWGTVTLSGPKAREILERVGTDVDLRPESFAHMSLRVGRVGGLAARIHRVSFTGELSYEINVPASETPGLWEVLLKASASDGSRVYGIEALNVLRTEKGYPHIGVETDGTTTPLDLGWGSIIERKPGQFVGRHALAMAEYQRSDRLHFVGVIPAEANAKLSPGAHLIDRRLRRSEGYLSSACFSPTLGHAVALARLERGRERTGEQLLAYDQGKTTPVRVVSPTFYDPANVRLQI